MNKVLIIANEYYPNPSAITNVFVNIIKEMQNRKYEVSVLTKRQNIDMLEEETIDNVKIYRVEDWFYNLYNITDRIKAYKASGIMKLANILSLCLYKIARYVSYYYDFRILNNQDGYINRKEAIKKGLQLNNDNKYDIIISLSYPFIMHEIANKIIKKSKNKPKWITYQFDPNAMNNTLSKKLYNKRLNNEIKVLKNCDAIFLPEENYIQNINTKLNILKNKYNVFQYANISKPAYEGLVQTDDIVKFVYTGTLYKDIREPQRVLDFFVKIEEDNKFKLKVLFYFKSVPEITDIVNSYKKKLGDCLQIVENADKDECDIISSNANILINIGNSVPNQTPSKVFENISLGKPIINFYSIENDTSKKQLEKYKMKLNINTNENYTENLLKIFYDFVDKYKFQQLSFDKATVGYELAENVAKKFVDIIGELKNAKD